MTHAATFIIGLVVGMFAKVIMDDWSDDDWLEGDE